MKNMSSFQVIFLISFPPGMLLESRIEDSKDVCRVLSCGSYARTPEKCDVEDMTGFDKKFRKRLR